MVLENNFLLSENWQNVGIKNSLYPLHLCMTNRIIQYPMIILLWGGKLFSN